MIKKSQVLKFKHFKLEQIIKDKQIIKQTNKMNSTRLLVTLNEPTKTSITYY